MPFYFLTLHIHFYINCLVLIRSHRLSRRSITYTLLTSSSSPRWLSKVAHLPFSHLMLEVVTLICRSPFCLLGSDSFFVLLGLGSFACKQARTGSSVLAWVWAWFLINVDRITCVPGLIPFQRLHPKWL